MNLRLRSTLLITSALIASALVFSGSAAAKPWWMRGVTSNEDDFLPPDVAFHVSSRVDGDHIRVHWKIADGYYLYRQKMNIEAESPELVLATPIFPPGTPKSDPYLGTQQIYIQQVEGNASYQRYDGGAHPIQIKVTYQGCAEAGLCYPAITKVLFPGAGVATTVTARQMKDPWEGYAAAGGALAFLIAGLLLRKERRLDMPA